MRNTAFGGQLFFGYDQGIPLADDYQPPFRFGGRICRGIYAVPPASASTGDHDELETVLRHE
jgi:hypothetical protein